MAILRPFSALRPPPDRAAAVSSVPYDVVTTSEARALAEGNPWSFLRVSRPEIELPDGADPHADEVYERAASNFGRLRRGCPLLTEEVASLYVYRLRMRSHEQIGVAGCFSVDEYDSDIIRKHERTRKDKEDDRTRHIVALRAQTGPVFLAYRDRPEIDGVVASATRGRPLCDVTAPDGVAHTIWRLDAGSTARLVVAFAAVPRLYIADGHHRAASASRARRQLMAAGAPQADGAECSFFLAVAFPAGQLQILPYNRVVKDLNGRSPVRFLSDLSAIFTVAQSAPPEPSRKGDISFYLEGRWRGLSLPPGAARPSGPISALDVSILQDLVLEPLLGIKDVRTDERIDFVGGVRGTKELERRVDSGRAAVAFSMHPVSLDELMAISDAGEIMPPKSTWFEPKLRDGFLIHEI